MGFGAADDDADRAGVQRALGDRGAFADEHAILGGDGGDLAARGAVHAVDIDAVAISELEASNDLSKPLSSCRAIPAGAAMSNT